MRRYSFWLSVSRWKGRWEKARDAGLALILSVAAAVAVAAGAACARWCCLGAGMDGLDMSPRSRLRSWRRLSMRMADSMRPSCHESKILTPSSMTMTTYGILCSLWPPCYARVPSTRASYWSPRTVPSVCASLLDFWISNPLLHYALVLSDLLVYLSGTRFSPLSLVNNIRQSYHSPDPSTFIAATRQTITLVPRFCPH